MGDTLENSSLFIKMLRKLDSHYAAASRIHVIVDNYGIHMSAETKAALGDMPRIQLHFLPPYCPDENRIERMWRELRRLGLARRGLTLASFRVFALRGGRVNQPRDLPRRR